MKIMPEMTRKEMKKIARLSVGRFVMTKIGRMLCLEEDFPIMRMFTGNEVITMNVDEFHEVLEPLNMRK